MAQHLSLSLDHCLRIWATQAQVEPSHRTSSSSNNNTLRRCSSARTAFLSCTRQNTLAKVAEAATEAEVEAAIEAEEEAEEVTRINLPRAVVRRKDVITFPLSKVCYVLKMHCMLCYLHLYSHINL